MLVGVYIDTNLLVLLIAGLTDPSIISKHRRTQQFTSEDYELLLGIVERARQVFVTPHTLTEASNLLTQHGEPERSNLLLALRGLIERSEETVISSRDASNHDRFLRLGLTDAALLKTISKETPLVTVDLELCSAALAAGEEVALNFNHMRFSEL